MTAAATETGAAVLARLKGEAARLGPLSKERAFSGWGLTWGLALDDILFSSESVTEKTAEDFLARGAYICVSHGPLVGQAHRVEVVTQWGLWVVGRLAAHGAHADALWLEMARGGHRGLSVRFVAQGARPSGVVALPAAVGILEVSLAASPSDGSARWAFGERDPIPPKAMPDLGEGVHMLRRRHRRAQEVLRRLGVR